MEVFNLKQLHIHQKDTFSGLMKNSNSGKKDFLDLENKLKNTHHLTQLISEMGGQIYTFMTNITSQGISSWPLLEFLDILDIKALRK